MDRVAYFMDSIYKGYPFGSLLFWRTSNRLTFERNLGPFTLPPAEPNYPINYVLDGQQRVTSIFAVFQTELELPSDTQWKNIYLTCPQMGVRRIRSFLRSTTPMST